jgi:hypothetical protein
MLCPTCGADDVMCDCALTEAAVPGTPGPPPVGAEGEPPKRDDYWTAPPAGILSAAALSAGKPAGDAPPPPSSLTGGTPLADVAAAGTPLPGTFSAVPPPPPVPAPGGFFVATAGSNSSVLVIGGEVPSGDSGGDPWLTGGDSGAWAPTATAPGPPPAAATPVSTPPVAGGFWEDASPASVGAELAPPLPPPPANGADVPSAYGAAEPGAKDLLRFLNDFNETDRAPLSTGG